MQLSPLWRQCFLAFMFLGGVFNLLMMCGLFYWLDDSMLGDSSAAISGATPPPMPQSTLLLTLLSCWILGASSLVLIGAGATLLIKGSRISIIHITRRQLILLACLFFLLLGASTFYSPYHDYWSCCETPYTRETMYGYPVTISVEAIAPPFAAPTAIPPAQPMSDVLTSWSSSNPNSNLKEMLMINALYYLLVILDLFAISQFLNLELLYGLSLYTLLYSID